MTISPFKEFKDRADLPSNLTGSSSTNRFDAFRQGSELTTDKAINAGIVNIHSNYNSEIEQVQFGAGILPKEDTRFIEIREKFNPTNYINSQIANFTPKYIAGLNLWLRSDLGLTVTSAATISQWNDQSGNSNNNNAVAQLSGDRPALLLDAVNSYPAVRFDGTASFLTITGNSSLWTQAFTAIVVGKTVSLGGASNEGGIFGINISNRWQLTHYAGDGKIYGYLNSSGNSVNDVISTGIYFIIIFYWNGTTGTNGLRLYNGTTLLQQKASSANAYTQASNILLGKSASSGNFWQGDLAEVLFYGRELKMGELDRLVNYLKIRYNL